MTSASSIICTGCQHSYVHSALFCPNCGRPKVREAAGDALVGKLLGERFQVQELIGQGASGTIYRAEHITLRRRVAIKVLHTELSRDDLAVERFRREATTVAEIDNEHIVEIHDFGRTNDGRLYLAMELLEGETLDGVLAREHQVSVERTADILIQVGEALMEAHAIGYVHRDLRPRNIYLAVRRGKANFVKLLDFGLSKLVESDAQAASTSLGMTFGDPRYMSPEQARGDRIDRRADIYQLGCIAYEMLTGSPPFTGSRVFDILTKQVTEIPAPLPTKRPGVPLWMEAAAAKMLAKDPENRFATTTRMVEALRRGLETGEIMEDDVARRRESIPPPSVSRVMQRFGVSQDQPIPSSPVPSPNAPPLPAAAPAPTPAPAAAVPAPAKPQAVVVEEAEPRKRTGTPRVGVPIVAAPEAVPEVVQAPVTGSIEAPAGRSKRSSSHGDPMGISQVWYEDGDRASDEADETKPTRARKPTSPSTTDLNFYEDEPRRRGNRGLMLVIGGAFALGGVIAFAMTRGGDKPPKQVAAAAVTEPAAVTIDAAPSMIIGEADAAVVAEVTPPPVANPPPVVANPPPVVANPPPVVANPPPVKTTTVHQDHPAKTPKDVDLGKYLPPVTANPPPLTTHTAVTAPTVTPPTPKQPSVTGGPEDPYGAASGGDPGDGAAPEKKAEFYASLGAQQLASHDTANAAANFKKASELDGKNAAAFTGMGEIALSQGLFGDAVAHLRKAVRLAPKSSHVVTLLGEAYLNSGQNAIAAENFKKALQLDPDNAQARDGYNEASSRVPPPSDDN